MQITIRGYSFTISEPFQAGTIITRGEAQALCGLRAENIQNNLRKLVADAEASKPDGQELIGASQLAEIQSKITQYDTGYQFLEKHTPRPRLGDIELEAREVARERVEAGARAQSRELNEDELEQAIAANVALPNVQEEARIRVVAKRRALSSSLADL